MGLFVAQDGYYQGWLATLLCCFAAVGEDEHPAELDRSRGMFPRNEPSTYVDTLQPLLALLSVQHNHKPL